MATQWPVVHARLVSLLQTLPGWGQVSVYDGPPVTGDNPATYATVGYVLDESSGGSFSHTRSGGGYQVEETGTVRCELVATVGDADLTSVRTRAFGLLDALEQSLRTDQTLGVMPQGATAELSVDVLPLQTQTGAQQRLPFSLNYFVRT